MDDGPMDTMRGHTRPTDASPVSAPVPGRVVLVGAGPGDAELLTLKAARLIGEARWLVHDALVHDDVLALARRATRIAVGKRAGRHSVPQVEINRLLVECARQGGLVVRLKGGDPLLFARAQEEIEALDAAGIPVEIVPGITTAQAAHAALGVPMTRRGSRRAIVLATPQTERCPGPTARARAGDRGERDDDLQWARAIVNAGGGAIYMAATAAARIRATLLSLGLPADTPVTWAIDVARPEATHLTGTLGGLGAPPPAFAGRPALLLVGSAPREHARSGAARGHTDRSDRPKPVTVRAPAIPRPHGMLAP